VQVLDLAGATLVDAPGRHADDHAVELGDEDPFGRAQFAEPSSTRIQPLVTREDVGEPPADELLERARRRVLVHSHDRFGVLDTRRANLDHSTSPDRRAVDPVLENDTLGELELDQG